MPSKRFRALVKEHPPEALPLPDAIRFVKSHATARFDETVELHVRLGVDPKKTDQAVRGTVRFPHGSASAVRVVVFASDPKLQEAAKAAGADLVGGKELIEDVRAQGVLTADVAVATPDIMNDLATVAKILGPKGLMPNPKTGTIGPDPAVLVRELKGGKTAFKMDDGGNLHFAIGKASWDTDKLMANARAVLEALRHVKPVSVKGEYLKSAILTSTMGTGMRVRA